ncbi:MAG: hypothetical protein COW24_00780 [Candidatus Kerfeldbacteria bacterium CG15_BIG_FIL_POST_REV_8_21_14_020_45_12]|uniref:Fibronectin type-III domain-containing protein n=1 Tax=Candidatus Kerfeldbacteria bacterium CG15_BIG_FIL_POST_REV_8_21_14_020_45_12 TaxID=2014247 RepID=A0A2M7H538_9BACT|nr:MAG: hypothetical protein COW24_00780 [Candidatus Kerfeldbacteria bacterium CG15_BIG_FIL_POST_REV_8_21_14_020_45_12]PJA93152.1 MAG: hypothetical protein CO132_04600 [Candidatus Kerfeldbacteria bacterium CG_4_9_14_3_um_filter_45_8]
MRKITFGLLVSFILAMPTSAALAVDDASVTSVSVTPSSVELSATEVTHTLLVTTSDEVSKLSCYIFTGSSSNPGGILFEGPTVDVSSSDMELSPMEAALFDGSEGDGEVVGFIYNFGSSLSVGDHNIVMSGLTNPDADGTYRIGCTSYTGELKDADYTYSDTFDIGEGAAASSISALTWTVDPAIIGAVADYELTITVDSEIASGSQIYTFFLSEGDSDPSASEIDLSSAVFSSDTVVGDFTAKESTNYASGSVELTEALAAGEHTLTLSGVQNAPSAKSLTAEATTDPSDESTYVFSEQIDFVALSAPAKKNMEVVKKKKKQVTLDWSVATGAETYTVQVKKCKNDLKKKCTKAKHYQAKKKYRKFTGVTKSKKVVKKLQVGTYYQWRVKSCLTEECSDFTTWKRFMTKN